MSLISNTVSRIPLSVSVPDERELRRRGAWRVFKVRVEYLASLERLEDALPAFEVALQAYRDLRNEWIKPRKRRKTTGKDAGLDRWAKQRGTFYDVFYGRLERRNGKLGRWFLGVEPETAAVMRLWQNLWTITWPHTAAGKESKKRRNAKQAKRPEVIVAKQAYAASERGKAAQARASARKRRASRVAKGAAEQALYDSWADADAAEEALKNV